MHQRTHRAEVLRPECRDGSEEHWRGWMEAGAELTKVRSREGQRGEHGRVLRD